MESKKTDQTIDLLSRAFDGRKGILSKELIKIHKKSRPIVSMFKDLLRDVDTVEDRLGRSSDLDRLRREITTQVALLNVVMEILNKLSKRQLDTLEDLDVIASSLSQVKNASKKDSPKEDTTRKNK